MHSGTDTKSSLSVRLSESEIRQLLDTVDRQFVPEEIEELRRGNRLKFRSSRVVVHTLNENRDVQKTLRVATRNLSASGMSFLHGQMMPPGQAVLIELPLNGDDTRCILARVAHCRHLRGMVHEIGLEFQRFVDRAPAPSGS